ncbi:hypothetical protein KIN20_016575 [Parelaphostrongylus tenuis]|uniref:Uncharacterized protein n=1 Tax=Parelaphostrongylus tenuis TaxID=148309 RepID=A0AAD5MGN2_PARTN|nr:hypothetical protein KIN20_016575 [Parelaphostrongylus tenuis]
MLAFHAGDLGSIPGQCTKIVAKVCSPCALFRPGCSPCSNPMCISICFKGYSLCSSVLGQDRADSLGFFVSQGDDQCTWTAATEPYRRPRKREPSRELIFRHRIDPPVTELPLAVSEIDKLSSEWIYVQKEPKMITAASNLERPAVPTDIPAPPSSQLLVPSHRETHLVPATMLPG